MYDLDSSLYDNDDSENVGRSIAAFPEGAGAIGKRGAAYSQWRKNGKRSQVRTEMGYKVGPRLRELKGQSEIHEALGSPYGAARVVKFNR